MKDIDLSGVEKYVTETIKDLSGFTDTSYQNEKWYKRTLTTIRATNVFMCFILVSLFVLAGGV